MRWLVDWQFRGYYGLALVRWIYAAAVLSTLIAVIAICASSLDAGIGLLDAAAMAERMPDVASATRNEEAEQLRQRAWMQFAEAFAAPVVGALGLALYRVLGEIATGALRHSMGHSSGSASK